MDKDVMAFPGDSPHKRAVGAVFYKGSTIVGATYLKDREVENLDTAGFEKAGKTRTSGKSKLQKEREEWGLSPWEWFLSPEEEQELLA